MNEADCGKAFLRPIVVVDGPHDRQPIRAASYSDFPGDPEDLASAARYSAWLPRSWIDNDDVCTGNDERDLEISGLFSRVPCSLECEYLT